MGAAAVVTIGLDVLQGIINALPGGLAVWQAIVGLRTQNPNMSAAEALAFMQNLTSVIGTLGADEVAQLSLIPAAPPTAPKVA